jgi:phenylacetic acid degradation operon negative regulatory protein
MTQITSPEWIAAFLQADPPRSKSLVMTIFGDAIAPHGGSVWLGSLIELLAPFGINDRLLRTSVFRLVQEGWLVSSRDGRRSNYSILPSALPRFERAYRRIYAPLDRQWDGNWTLLFTGPSAVDAPERTALRKELLWEGFAQVAQGLFAQPSVSASVVDDIAGRLHLQGKLFVCRALDEAAPTARPLRELVPDCWDLSEVMARYAQFGAQFEPLLAALNQGAAWASLSRQQAYVIRTLVIHAYRRVQLHDPMLPVELLPSPWPGSQAYALARDIYLLTTARAEEHVVEVMRAEDKQAPLADAAFFERFGGLRAKLE